MLSEQKHRFSFTYNERLHDQKDFKKAFTLGRRLTHPALFIYKYSRSTGPDFPRMGLSTSKKVGIAVKRNRVKRLLREVFRLNKNCFARKTDVVFVPKKEIAGLSFNQVEDIVLSLLRKGNVIIDDKTNCS